MLTINMCVHASMLPYVIINECSHRLAYRCSKSGTVENYLEVISLEFSEFSYVSEKVFF